MRKSHRISLEEFSQRSINAETLEQDEYGIKVLRLENGDIFKLFRVKNIISSARVYSYARRFCRNAERLQKLGVATVRVKQLFHFTNSTNTAVLYEPLLGNTLWQVFSANELNESLLAKLGEFVARLHQKGVYFRSLHLGNIVLTSEGELGLIDISDMSISPWSLGYLKRLRNFRQMLRRQQGLNTFDLNQRKVFLDSYVAHSQNSSHSKYLSKKLEKILTHQSGNKGLASE